MDIDGRINTDKLENKISSIYENLIYYYNLSINRRKSNFNKTENIFSDLKSFSILEDYDEISSVPTEYKNHLFDFLSDLVKFSEKGSVNYKKYTELVNEYFDDPNSTYHASQILYILIYKNIEWLKETRIIKKISKNN